MPPSSCVSCVVRLAFGRVASGACVLLALAASGAVCVPLAGRVWRRRWLALARWALGAGRARSAPVVACVPRPGRPPLRRRVRVRCGAASGGPCLAPGAGGPPRLSRLAPRVGRFLSSPPLGVWLRRRPRRAAGPRLACPRAGRPRRLVRGARWRPPRPPRLVGVPLYLRPRVSPSPVAPLAGLARFSLRRPLALS